MWTSWNTWTSYLLRTTNGSLDKQGKPTWIRWFCSSHHLTQCLYVCPIRNACKDGGKRHSHWISAWLKNVEETSLLGDASCKSLLLELTRLHIFHQWEIAHAKSEEHIRFDFPEPDLLASLVSLYFEKSNIILPILHRPTFLRSLDSGLHLTDTAFAMTVLLVCAIGSGFTSDSRVLLDGDISDLSSGWKYFIQVPVFRKSLFVRSTIYDLQCYTVRSFASWIEDAWLSSYAAFGRLSTWNIYRPCRLAHARFGGPVHTRKRHSSSQGATGAHGEGWIREISILVGYFSDTLNTASLIYIRCLICLDRWMSAFLGRPCAMQDEE